jgi:4-hydroxyproline epimerase
MLQLRVIDSHTGGEPTRSVVSGGPALGDGPLPARVARFRDQYDRYRSAIVNEPRGNDAMVGALLVEPHEPGCHAGVIFFNNVGYLGMCGHGAIGVVVTLGWLGRIQPGVCRLDTPVGAITAEWHGGNEVTIGNVPAYRYRESVEVSVPGIGAVRGDIAWGGNWFFLVEGSPVDLSVSRVEELTEYTWRIRQALSAQGITGAGGAEIDHIELFVEPAASGADSRNFVLCPGKAYDRSPCGTGTSAKLACLAAAGKLGPDRPWRQESVVGSVFEGRYQLRDGQILPSIRGAAYVCADSTLLVDESDPFCWGIRT